MKISSETTSRFISSTTQHRIASDQLCVADEAQAVVSEWRSDGSFVVGNSGAYDILSVNHVRGLIQARLVGAIYMLEALGQDPYESVENLYTAAGSSDIKLLVSLDTNSALQENKSMKESSGGAIRPVLDWDTRALMLSFQAFGCTRNLVDFITRHGPQACNFCEEGECLHESKEYSVASTGVDLTVAKDRKQASLDRYSDREFYIINEEDGAITDRVLCGQISTSAIIRRIRGGKKDE